MREIASLMFNNQEEKQKFQKFWSVISLVCQKKEEDIFYDHALVKNSNHRSLG